MSEKQKQSPGLDDDLLKNAIPIDELADEDDEDLVEEDLLEEEGTDTVKSGYVAESVPTVDLSDGAIDSKRKVESLGAKTARKELWAREVDRSSHGASHVKTFVAKLTKEGISYMDEQINQWLAENPNAEVKFVTVAQGDIVGRTREPSLLVNIWV